jgi:hypothetical protein
MKTKILFLSLAFIVTLASCSKDADLTTKATTAQTSADFTTENGYIKFKNQKAYLDAYTRISNASETELKIWNNQLPFKTLRSTNEENNKVSQDSTINQNSDDLTLNSLLNKDGIMVCGDSIIKLKGEYLYFITNGNFELIRKIESGEDISNEKNIFKKRHSLPLKTEIKNDARQKTLSTSPVIKYASNKREFVHMEAFLRNLAMGPVYVEYILSGVAQTLFIYWQPPYGTNMSYGQIVLSGTTNGVWGSMNTGVISNTQRISCWHSTISQSTYFEDNVTYNYKMPHSAPGSTTLYYNRQSFNDLGY